MAKWKKVLGKVASPFVKPVQKFAKKFLPKELRPWLPMATAFMPYTGIMGAMGGPMGFAKMYSTNLLAQAMADPDADVEELNQLSAFLSGTQGGLMGTDTAQNLRGMTTKGKWGIGTVPDHISGVPENVLKDRSFWTKTKDLGLEGLATASDYLQGGAETLGALGSGEAINVADAGQAAIMKDLFTKQGAIEAAKAAGVPFAKGMGDVTEAYQRPLIRDWEAADAAERAEIEATTTANESDRAYWSMRFMREAGHDEEVVKETLEENELGEYYEPPVTAANGGIIGLKHGGMLNFGGREMDLRGGGFVPIGRKERADDVPARLSKNEFVMTADAVRAAGGGDVNKGAQRMYNVMNNLEARA